MKKLLSLSAGLGIAVFMPAQQVQYNPDGSTYQQCLAFRVTKPLSELITERTTHETKDVKYIAHPAPDAAAHERPIDRIWKKSPNVNTLDSARQTENGTIEAPASTVNIDGQQSTLGEYPLDPNGMIGSNYYVQAVNSNYAVYSKSGATILPPTDLHNIFGSLGTGDCGDPVVLYDKMADRWVITEFENCCNFCSVDSLIFAVSTTNNPLGTYYLYAFDPKSSNTDDYPKYVVWADGYYGTCNCANTDYVFAFDRTKMLAGNPTAGLISIPWHDDPLKFGGQGGFFCPMMLDCDGTLPPYGSPEFLFYYWDDNWGAGGTDEICIDKISVNWVSKTGTSSHYDTLPTAPFNSTFTGGSRADIAQPGNSNTNYLDALDGFFSYRIPYLSWNSYNTAVMSHVVNVGSGGTMVGGIRWYELHQDTTTKVWSIYQQSTYAPNDGVSRWNPAIAMDQNKSIGLAYSVSDPISVYPGCRYTGRRSCDALNTMTISEVNAFSGNALANTPQAGGNRWGDYSHLSVDPIDGITFWNTNMYTNNGYGFGSNVGTRIYSFQIPDCAFGIPSVNSDEAALTAYQSGSMITVKGTDFPQNERLSVQLFDINGKMLATKDMVSTSQTMATSFNVSALAKAIYLVRIGNDHMQRVIKIAVN